MYVAEGFLSNLVEKYGQNPVSIDCEITWYPQACKLLNINHHMHSPYEKSIIEVTMQFIKDRIKEYFDD
jgi:putative transposase